MSVATKNTQRTATEEAKPLYFPRAIAETAQEKGYARTANKMIRDKKSDLATVQISLEELEMFVERSGIPATEPHLELERQAYELCIKGFRSLLHGMETYAAWTAGASLSKQAAKTGVEFTPEEATAVFKAARTEYVSLSDASDEAWRQHIAMKAVFDAQV